ncbi:MAG: Ig-like domain-containing protein [Acidobacteria bacterium]|nr:Ig-like domain-containing protein [Acidobacteriota bacterium]
MRTVLLFALIAAKVSAQGPVASVQVLAPSLRVIAGEQVQLTSVVRDAAGNVRPNDITAWSVDNTNLATVSGGVLTTKTIGIVSVRATMSGVTGALFIQILPKKLTLSPERVTLTVGETAQFTVIATDKNDQPLPNPNFTWSATSTNGGTTNTCTIRNGLLTTLATGDVQVRAAIGYNTSVPGFDRYLATTANVSIRPPKSYAVSKLVSSGPLIAGPFELRGRIVQLLGNENGQFVFNSEMSGLVNGPLMFHSGFSKLLMHGGMPGMYPQSMVAEFNYLAVNNNAELLVHCTVLGSNNTIFKTSWEGDLKPVFIDSSPLPGTELLTGSYFSRNSLNDGGDFVMRVNYRVQNTGPTFTALYIVPTRGFPNQVANTADGLPGFPPPYNLDTDFGIDGSGQVYFTATSGSRRALFVNSYGDVRKVVEIGMPLLGSTVSRFLGNGFMINSAGDLGVGVGLANGQLHLLKYSGGKWDAPEKTLRMTNFGNLFAMNPKVGALFLGDVGRGYGLQLWDGGTEAKTLFAQGNNNYLLRGKSVPTIDWATINNNAEVTFFVRSQDKIMELLRLNPGETVPTAILAAGDPVPGVFAARVGVNNILNGDRTGPVHLLTGGRGSSIHEVSEAGELKPVLLHGERYSTNALFTGANTGDSRKIASGELFVTPTNGAGLVRIKGGTSELVVRPGMALEDASTINSPSNVSGNARGDLLIQASTNRGDTRLVLISGGKNIQLLTNSAAAAYLTKVDGQDVIGWSDHIVDETGRVMATLRFRDNTAALHVYQGGSWRRVAVALETRVNGSLVNSYTQIRAAGDSFYAIFSLAGIGNTLMRYKANWEVAFAVNEILATGQRTNSIGNYDVNRNGDILAQCNTNTQVVVVKRADGKIHYIHMLNELTPDGDLLVRTSDFDLRDDGTVYFLGMNVLDEYALYMAKPLN